MANIDHNEETYFGVLMNRRLIDNGIYLFKPEYLIEGTIEQEDKEVYFTDTMANEYLMIHDTETLTSDEETAVGYIISDEELTKKYPELSIPEAKIEYFDSIRNLAHIGFYLAAEDKIAVMPFDLMTMSQTLNNMELDPNSNVIKIPAKTLKQPDISEYDGSKDALSDAIDEFGGQERIVMSPEKFKDLLETKTFSELKAKLERIKAEYESIKAHFVDEDVELKEPKKINAEIFFEKKVTGQHILDLFNASYDAILAMDDIEELKRTIGQIIEIYTDLSLVLDEKEKSGCNINAAEDYIYTLVDKYDELLKLDDISLIKKGIAEIKKTEFNNIKAVSNTYDELSKKNELMKIDSNHEKTQIELEEMFKKEKKARVNVKEIKSFFDAKIIGQEAAKKAVVSAIVKNQKIKNGFNKNSCLLVGPTGSGKTLIAEAASEYFDMPIEIYDITQLTVPGYVGANIEDCLVRLMEKAKGDIKKAEEGILVFDEIDKKGSEKNDDVSGKGVLNTLLPFLQGTTYDIKYNGKPVHFNTAKLTIFATGAFTDVAKGKANDSSSESYKGTHMGFNADIKNTGKDAQDIKYEKLEIDDFVKYGHMPRELMGRFSTIAQLDGLTLETLKTILTKSNASPLLAEKQEFEEDGINLSWTDGYLTAIANQAIKLKTGARSLKNTVESSIKEVRWEVLENPEDYIAIILTDKTVDDNLDCEIIDQNGDSRKLKDILEARNIVIEPAKVKQMGKN